MDLINLGKLVGEIVFVQILFHDNICFIFNAEKMVHQLIELKMLRVGNQRYELGEVFISECL